MEEIDKMIEGINAKILKIIEQRETARKGLSALIEENKQLSCENEDLRRTIEIQNKQNFNSLTKDTVSLKSTEDKVSELIKEIDLCIKLIDD